MFKLGITAAVKIALNFAQTIFKTVKT